MPRINLLPWRDELRTERRNQFFIALGAATAVAALIILIGNLTFNSIIGHQQDRNRLLQSEIDLLNIKIKEILDLEAQKGRLLARMEIIEQLQKSRPEIVHLFDEIVRQLPEGVYLTGMKQTGSRVEIRGVAQSSTRVSALMRQIDASDWMGDPEVERVETKQAGSSRQSEFVVYLKQKRLDSEEEEL